MTRPTSIKSAETKYRPVLTSEQILHILYLAKSELPSISTTSMSLISTLAPFQAKIENSGITAAYTTTPRTPTNTLEALGAGTPESASLATSNLVKEVYWQNCYNKYTADPIACTLDELLAAKEHMYLNDLMTEAELTDFEEQYNGS